MLILKPFAFEYQKKVPNMTSWTWQRKHKHTEFSLHAAPCRRTLVITVFTYPLGSLQMWGPEHAQSPRRESCPPLASRSETTSTSVTFAHTSHNYSWNDPRPLGKKTAEGPMISTHIRAEYEPYHCIHWINKILVMIIKSMSWKYPLILIYIFLSQYQTRLDVCIFKEM